MEATPRANVDKVRAQLQAINARDVEAALADVDDAIVYEAPAYRLRVEGKEALGRMFHAVLEKFTETRYEVTAHLETVDTDLVIVEARGDNAVRGTDRRYANRYLHVVRFRDGRMVHWTEHSDPTTYATQVDGDEVAVDGA